MEGEAAGAHQHRARRPPPDAHELVPDPHLHEAVLRRARPLAQVVGHVTPVERVVGPPHEHRTRREGARPLHVLLGQRDVDHREEVAGAPRVADEEGEGVPLVAAVDRDVIAAERRELEVAESLRPPRDERVNLEAHLGQDLRPGGGRARREINRDRPLEPRERRDVEVVVVLVREDDGVNLGEAVRPQEARGMNAILPSACACPNSSQRRGSTRMHAPCRVWNTHPCVAEERRREHAAPSRRHVGQNRSPTFRRERASASAAHRGLPEQRHRHPGTAGATRDAKNRSKHAAYASHGVSKQVLASARASSLSAASRRHRSDEPPHVAPRWRHCITTGGQASGAAPIAR